jgi:hypothetical protein
MGQYPLRVPDYILDQVRAAAVEENVSVNQLLGALIAEGLGHRQGVRAVRARAERGDPQRALAILESIEGTAPDADDEMPTAARAR